LAKVHPFSLNLIPTNIAIFSFSLEGEFIIDDLNRRAQISEKVQLESLKGKSITALFPEVEQTGLLEVMRRVHYTGVTEELQHTYSPTGGWRKHKIYKLDDGKLMQVYENLSSKVKETSIDFERKKQLSDRKRDDKDVLLTLFDKGSSVLFKWNNDAHWNVLYVSKSVEGLLGYTRDEFLKNKVSYASCIHEEDLRRVHLEVQQALAENKQYFEHQPYRVYTKNADVKWVYDSTIIERDEKGKVLHFVGYTIDITEMKQKEQQLLLHMKQAQMGEMISMIAHQWRQPLATISVLAANVKMNLLFQNYDLQNEQKAQEFVSYLDESLSEIENLTQVLSQTVDDFRTFYMPGKDPIVENISVAIQKSLEILSPSFKEHKIELLTSFQSDKKIENFDTEMMQVFVNILKNSEDNFIEKKIEQKKIYINTYDTSQGVIVEIIDNGLGIDEAVLNRIYEPYFSTKTKKNGTGLGLYMSKMIVEEHHRGEISVKNIHNGVCFRISLHDKISPF